jgi:hypothetical protein
VIAGSVVRTQGEGVVVAPGPAGESVEVEVGVGGADGVGPPAGGVQNCRASHLVSQRSCPTAAGCGPLSAAVVTVRAVAIQEPRPIREFDQLPVLSGNDAALPLLRIDAPRR